MLSRLSFVIVFFIVLVVSGCQRTAHEPTLLHGSTMGTTWSVTLADSVSASAQSELQEKLQARLDQINRLMSTYDPGSELSRFNDRQSRDWFPMSAETVQVIALSLEISELSGGLFDVSVGPLVDLWGFGPKPQGEELPTERQVQEALSLVGYQHIEVRLNPPAVKKQVPQLRIDLSAIAKGYAVDALAAILKKEQFADFLVEVGGELRISGQRGDGSPWRIAVEKPLDDSRQVEVVFPLTDVALATSGNYRNFYIVEGQRYAHTIDPLSGQPVSHKLASATVLDRDCARADALATALMAMGEVRAREFCQKLGIAAYLLIHHNEGTTAYMSPAFKSLVEE